MKRLINSNDHITQISIGDIDTARLHEIHDLLSPHHWTWIPDDAKKTRDEARLESMGVYVIRAPSKLARDRDERYNNQDNSNRPWKDSELTLWDEVEDIGNALAERMGMPAAVYTDRTDLQYIYCNFKSMFGWNPSSWWHIDLRKTCVLNIVVTGSENDYVDFTNVDYEECRTMDRGPRSPEFIEKCNANITGSYGYTENGNPTPTLLNTPIPHRACSHNEDRILFRLAFSKSSYELVRSWLTNDCE